MKTQEFRGASGVIFEIYRGAKTGLIKVRISENSPDWDYGDCYDAKDLSDEVRGCKSIEEALEVLREP